ncbi:MAG: guanylate kinase [Thermodesulfovibrionales bacterium]|nr:guanylate kinase [Thermodesulfovibrionales bacterium]
MKKGKVRLRRKGILFIVSGPSGAGKTTLYKEVALALPNLKHSVSFTTRPPRPGEVNDRDYTFISRDEFKEMIDKGEFVEWAEIHGELYGTSKKRLEEIMDSGFDVILDIDTQGAMQLKEKYKGGVYIFVLTPSMEVLKERLRKRMANSKEEIEKRLKGAVEEIKKYREYDYVIVNNVFEDAFKELEAIIISHRVSTKRVDLGWIEKNF